MNQAVLELLRRSVGLGADSGEKVPIGEDVDRFVHVVRSRSRTTLRTPISQTSRAPCGSGLETSNAVAKMSNSGMSVSRLPQKLPRKAQNVECQTFTAFRNSSLDLKTEEVRVISDFVSRR